MTDNITNTKTNYKKIDDIASEIRHSEIEDFLEFYDGDKYKFLKCEMCNGHILGHIEVKCRSLDGARYDKEVVESLQNWMKRNKTFQQAVTERNKKNKNEEHEKMSETMKIMMESMESRNYLLLQIRSTTHSMVQSEEGRNNRCVAAIVVYL